MKPDTHARLKSLIADFSSPIVLRGASALFASKPRVGDANPQGGEKSAEWYDASFDACEHWSQHYSASEYYFLWSVIVDRIATSGARSILEIGCGTGQLASLIHDKVKCDYHGFDFSAKRVEYAQATNPDLPFARQDAFQTDLFAACDYDTAVCTEFLEHVEADTVVLEKVRPATRFLGTVPNFPFTSHVRHFKSEDEVAARYKPYFRDLRIDRFLADANGKCFYLLDGHMA